MEHDNLLIHFYSLFGKLMIFGSLILIIQCKTQHIELKYKKKIIFRESEFPDCLQTQLYDLGYQ